MKLRDIPSIDNVLTKKFLANLEAISIIYATNWNTMLANANDVLDNLM